MPSSSPGESHEPSPAAPTGVLRRLRAAGLAPRGVRGQHFLHDPRLLRAVVEDAGIGADDAVFEVGTGAGTLTRQLAARAGTVLTVEVDAAMLEFARGELGAVPNVRWLCADALDGQRLDPRVRAELEALGPFVWVANLPYGIASPLIVALLESELPWRRALLLVQAEVAERLAAAPGSRACGPLGMLVSYWAEVRPGRFVSPGAFVPPPQVRSRFVSLHPRGPLGDRREYAAYAAWVRRLFGERRKQIGGLLRSALGDGAAEQAIAGAAVDPRSRPEDLAPSQVLALARVFPLNEV